MKRAVKKVIRPALFLLIGVMLFVIASAVIMPKNLDKCAYVISGYRALEENTVDALFLGPSLVLDGVSPMQIYEDTGICAYSLATTGQPIELSYALLKVAFRTQQPKVVILNSSVFANDNVNMSKVQDELGQPKQVNYALGNGKATNYNAYWRWIIEAFPLGTDKITLIKEYLKMSYHCDLLSTLFPLLYYHDRWKSLTAEDFSIAPINGIYYAAGESVCVAVNPGIISLELANGIADLLEDGNVGHTTVYDGETTQMKMLTEPVYMPIISQQKLEYLHKIEELCAEHEAELILVSMPVVYFPPTSYGVWTEIKSNMMKELAADENIELIDLLYDYDDVIDFSTDSYDGGNHLNFLGAEKVSLALEPVLIERIPEHDRQNAVYEQMLTTYRRIREIVYLEMETDFTDYIDKLADIKDQCAIFIAACDDYTQGMTSQDYNLFQERLGGQMIENGVLADAYLAVLDRGELVYEELSDRRITHEMDILDADVLLVSSGTFHSQLASVRINGVEYALSRPGLNIVVYDYETGLVVDISAINTQEVEKPVSHGDVQPIFNSYEAAVRTADHNSEK